MYYKLFLIVICLFVGLEDVFFHPQSMRTEEGRDVFLQCVSGDSSPPAQISWLKNGRVLTKGNQIQVQNYKTLYVIATHSVSPSNKDYNKITYNKIQSKASFSFAVFKN